MKRATLVRLVALTFVTLGPLSFYGCGDDDETAKPGSTADAAADGTTDSTTGDGGGDSGGGDSGGNDAATDAPIEAAAPLPCLSVTYPDAGDAGDAGDADADAGPVDPDAGLTFAETAPNQTFGGNMVGCSGKVSHASRAQLCNPAAGCAPCGKQDWLTKFGTTAPTHHYWVNDRLRWIGPENACRVVDEDSDAGSSCGDTPMRVCMDGDGGMADTIDPSGNSCNWTMCSEGSAVDAGADAGDAAPPNLHFGGCAGDPTAGTLCCCP